jgi:hypothetical protein
MSAKSRRIAVAGVVLVLAVSPGAAASAGGCPTRVEELSGPTFNGAVPEGRAVAEMRFLCGGTTLLTVEVKNVNLPDGTVVDVALDFRPIGTITLSGGSGTLVADLGSFGVSNDEIRVSHAGLMILIGAFFR